MRAIAELVCPGFPERRLRMIVSIPHPLLTGCSCRTTTTRTELSTPGSQAPPVPLVLERPARAHRPGLDAVGDRDARRLAVDDGVELREATEPVERGEHP